MRIFSTKGETNKKHSKNSERYNKAGRWQSEIHMRGKRGAKMIEDFIACVVATGGVYGLLFYISDGFRRVCEWFIS